MKPGAILALALAAGAFAAGPVRAAMTPAGLDAGAHNLATVPPELTPQAKAPEQADAASIVCDLIEANARIAGMPPDFFARLIWRESRFDAGAVSPVGARGIAQFMPYTARERGLANPFDVAEAIRHSALYLRDLKADLGNWGLAAAAYNGGPNRVKRWRVAGGLLPSETERYVYAITARPAAWFLEAGREIEEAPLDAALDFGAACRQMPKAKARRAPALPADSAPMRAWGVQVAGSPDPSIAMTQFRHLQGRYARVLGNDAPIVMRVSAGRRRIYAVRMGADTHVEAIQLCSKLRQAGGSCIVFKN